uniref:aminotransferase class V-fold PLP-dependent enzyme n=1 Tax=Klebsiella pneumoniae TaxID=573 RepID=UPI003B98357B
GEIALVLWPGVQFRTGQSFDVARIVTAAHAAGCVAGVDLAHSIGNMPLERHAADADFAVWCGYKYLNAGPGAIGGCFVHRRNIES